MYREFTTRHKSVYKVVPGHTQGARERYEGLLCGELAYITCHRSASNSIRLAHNCNCLF